MLQQITATVRLLGDLLYRTAEVDIDNADLVIIDQTLANLCHHIGLVVPDLNRQWTCFIANAPQSIGVFGFVFIEPNKTTRVDHFRRLQTDAAIVADDLTKRIIRESCHRCLQDRRIDFYGADPQWRWRLLVCW